MRILITGSNGLLGQKLVALLLSQSDIEVIATSRGNDRLQPSSLRYHYHSMDVAKADQILKVFIEQKPNVVIHTAAMTNVDQCENDKKGCWVSNVETTKNVIVGCEKVSAKLIHLSTDFIFDGSEGPLTEEATPNPINYYGESKLEAEKLIRASKLNWAIARTVLVFGIVKDMSRSNIILWVKNSLEQGKEIKVVTDQFRTPTLAEDLAMGCFLIAKHDAKGVYNISGRDFLSPYEMAEQTAKYFNLETSTMSKADSSSFSQDAKRPAITGFILDKARKDLGYSPRSFLEGIAMVAEQTRKSAE